MVFNGVVEDSFRSINHLGVVAGTVDSLETQPPNELGGRTTIFDIRLRILKILAGILYPDGGLVETNGRIAPFIELGVGFHSELTARENVFLYGAIVGLKKSEIRDRYEEIFAFAELKEFENMRLKNFSSGMVVRLAFSTAIQADPDIMLVDEVLSVGDEYFQKKCSEKINELRENEKTIVFVSHALESVRRLCARSLLLMKGKMVVIGETPEVIVNISR